MLTVESSRLRLQRLQKVLKAENLDAAIIGFPEHVYYFSAFFTNWTHCSALALTADGRSFLVTANSPAQNTAAQEVGSYEAQWNATLRSEQAAEVARQVTPWLEKQGVEKVGMDASVVNSQLALQWNRPLTAIDPHLWQLRRRKDADELALMKKGIACTAAMYAKAKEILRPGIGELEMFTELQKTAVLALGEPLTELLGNDFRCGGGGGAPRKDRAAQPGELYILDLGPAYRGYFADNCRTFSVDGSVSDDQARAHAAIVGALDLVEKMARPGARCRDLFAAADEHLKAHYGKPLKHHLGHGVGLQPHEFPHLNSKWDDVLIEGEVFT
ncbi:MAG TPA: Xaa-Pro peptidase family protein, partial [Tepidisphaeraceae bacterium]|nr:Xaa-Pro peptidase family protein [Tepidisphaeraceae bacterium]